MGKKEKLRPFLLSGVPWQVQKWWQFGAKTVRSKLNYLFKNFGLFAG